MAGVIIIIAIVFTNITVVTLGSIWMGTSYAAKKRGLTHGVTKRELEEIQQDINQIQRDITKLKEQMADLIIIAQDNV